MSVKNISTSLAMEEDAPSIASIMTVAFAASDSAYQIIWGNSSTEMHDMVALHGLLTPLQRPERVTFKAVDSSGRIVGFATWTLPKIAPESTDREEELPNLPGINMELWKEKIGVSNDFYRRDVNPSNDMSLSFCFVHPEYQRRGIASLLLRWGTQKADELHANIWLTSTPQAVSTYEKSGWKVVDQQEIDLAKYGGEAVYIRAWMVRRKY